MVLAMLWKLREIRGWTQSRLVQGALLTSGAVLAWRLYKKRQADRRYWQECTRIRQERDEKLDRLERRLKELNLDERRVAEICGLALSELRAKLQSGELTALEVLRAYQYQALRAQKATNCLTNVFEDAEDVAKALDNKAEKTGLLHGIPVSIKDSVATAGHVNTWGCVRYGRRMPDKDALIVTCLREQGAIPFVKTNVPQIMMGMETGNAIYGTTTNPRDPTRTPGGSSGGEGALIAFGGSILGIGTDILGSIRIPSSFSGIAGFKPTSERLSKKGQKPYGQTTVRSCIGPMAKDVDSLVLTMQALLGPCMFDNDKTTPPLPFNNDVYSGTKPLTVGYYLDDSVHLPAPAITRAVKIAKSLLEKRGHKLVQWKPPKPLQGLDFVLRATSGDRGCLLRGFLGKDEKVHDSIIRLIKALEYPDILRSLLVFILRLTGDRMTATGFRALRGIPSVAALFQMITDVKLYIQEYEEEWRKSQLDAVICPTLPYPAMKLNCSAKVPMNAYYTGIYNLLDYPAGTVPVTHVTQEDVDQLRTYPRNTMLERYMVRDLQTSKGLPVGVQCVTPTWRDEVCLRVLKEMEQGVNDMNK